MWELLESSAPVPFLDETAPHFLSEGRIAYSRGALVAAVVLDQGTSVTVLTWLGDGANDAIACLLARRDMKAWRSRPGIELLKEGGAVTDLEAALANAAVDDVLPLSTLLEGAKNLEREKWDWCLPLPLLQKTYGSLQSAQRPLPAHRVADRFLELLNGPRFTGALQPQLGLALFEA